jgi:serine/threonine protein kinase
MQETSFSVGPLPGLEVIRSLGRGNAAEVFLAREPALGRLVAVKVVHPEVARDPIARRRFEREGLAAARVTQEGVAQVHRVGETPDGRPFLVMEYVKGRSLEERLEAEGPLAVAETRRILTALAESLHEVHAHGIVHRDVRPANVLEEDGTGRIVLTDFGLAGLLESGEGEKVRLTATGQVLGDWHFVTPEQLRGEKATGQADVYQLGVLVHYLVRGAGPFGGLARDRLAAELLEGEPQELVASDGSTDPIFAAMVRRCLARKPAERPTPADIVRKLSAGGGRAAEIPELDLIQRRVPHFVVLAVTLGLGAVGLVGEFIQNGGLPGYYFWIAVALAVHGVAASFVLSWYHGARGKQQVEPFEIALLALIGISFLTVGVLIVL